MNTIAAFSRWALLSMLLLGDAPLIRAHPVSTNQQQALLVPKEDSQPILHLITNALQFMALSHDDNLKGQAMRTITQSLSQLAKHTTTQQQKLQIRLLFRQTLQAISGFDNANWKIELLRTIPGMAASFSDTELVRELLPTIESLADSISNPIYKAGVLSELAEWAVKAGDQPTADKLLTQSLQASRDSITRQLTQYRLDQLGPLLVSSTKRQPVFDDSHWIRPVLLQLQEIEDDGILKKVMTRVSGKIALVSDKTQQQKLLDQLVEQVHGPLSDKLKTRLLIQLVEATVPLTDKTIRIDRLAQLKQEALKLRDKDAQAQVIREIYLVGIRKGDSKPNEEEFMKILLMGTPPAQRLNLMSGQSGAAFQFRILTQVLGTMARVAAQLDQPELAHQLTDQTLQAVIGIDTSPQLLHDLAILSAKSALPPTDSTVTRSLLRQAEQLAAGIDDLQSRMKAQGELVSLAAQAGAYTEARALLKQALQQTTQLAERTDAGGFLSGNTLGTMVASILAVANRAEAQFLVNQVIDRLREMPDGTVKAQAYTEVIQSLSNRAIHQEPLLDENQAYALVNQASGAVKVLPKPQNAYALTKLIHFVDYLCSAQSQSWLTQSVARANELVYPEKGLVQSAIIEGLGSRARRVLLAGDEHQAHDLFDQAMQLWTSIADTPTRTRAAHALVGKQALALVVIRNPAVFQRWLSQTQFMIKTVEPYASTLSLVVQTMVDQARQSHNAQIARSLFTHALQMTRAMNRLSRHPLPMYSLIQAGVAVLDRNQLRILLTQSLGQIKALTNSTTQTRELIALGHACAQRVPVEQVPELTIPILNSLQETDNIHLKEYALKGLVTINPQLDQKAPASRFWQQVLAVANTVDDAAAQAATRTNLSGLQEMSKLLLPEELIPTLETQQQVLQAANPSVRAAVYSKVAESMVYWNQFTQATHLLNQARPLYKIQLANGMLTGWLEREQSLK